MRMPTHKKDAKKEHPTTQEPESQVAQESVGQQPSADEIQLLEEQIQQLSAEREEAREQTLRALAELQNQQRDFQNYRRRTQQEMAVFRQLATEQLVTELLPVLDNFERTISHLDSGATVESLAAGINAVERQLRAILEAQSLRRIEAVGAAFDPELHEALGAEVTDEHPADMVVTEIEPGYKMGDKVIRPARVKVAKKP